MSIVSPTPGPIMVRMLAPGPVIVIFLLIARVLASVMVCGLVTEANIAGSNTISSPLPAAATCAGKEPAVAGLPDVLTTDNIDKRQRSSNQSNCGLYRRAFD